MVPCLNGEQNPFSGGDTRKNTPYRVVPPSPAAVSFSQVKSPISHCIDTIIGAGTLCLLATVRLLIVALSTAVMLRERKRSGSFGKT